MSARVVNMTIVTDSQPTARIIIGIRMPGLRGVVMIISCVLKTVMIKSLPFL